MKSLTRLVIILLFVCTSQTFAGVQGKDILPFFSFSTFYSHEQGAYLETYLCIPGKSVFYRSSTENGYMASVEATYYIKQEEKILDFKKIILHSPEIKDTTVTNFMLIDIQRFGLANGSYTIELKLNDINSTLGAIVIEDEFQLNFSDKEVQLSGIQLVEKYSKTTEPTILSKAGYDLVPLPINFYPQKVSSLVFYSELYNSNLLGAEEAFLIKSGIKEFETGKILSDIQHFKREKAKPLVIYMQEFNIAQLRSGNYLLWLEVRDKNNQLIASNQLFFQRSNALADSTFLTQRSPVELSFASAYTDKYVLAEHVRSLRPIATEIEKSFIDKKISQHELTSLQQFFYSFWLERDPVNPEEAWRKYEKAVQQVQNSFSTPIKKGYETDRGRVYLQYGAPNSISTQENEPSAYPYEIWHYFTLNNQSNRKFVFWNRDLVTRDFELLHSDAIGEIHDLQWQVKLHQRNFTTNDPDLQRSDWGWGSKVNDYWDNPR